jgi:hypothetical protein
MSYFLSQGFLSDRDVFTAAFADVHDASPLIGADPHETRQETADQRRRLRAHYWSGDAREVTTDIGLLWTAWSQTADRHVVIGVKPQQVVEQPRETTSAHEIDNERTVSALAPVAFVP